MNLGFRSFLLLSALLFVTSAGYAREWPDDPTNTRGAFGAPEDGHFSRGITFRTEGQRVSSWNNGEVIWVSNTAEISRGTVPGSGLVVIEHDNGFRSSYRGIERRPDLGRLVSGGEWLGYAGGDDWIFELSDTERSRIIDPLSLLPTRNDMKAATTGRVELLGSGNRIALSEGLELAPGRWTIVVNDVFSDDGSAIPLEISLYWVGERIGAFRFDALSESDQGIVMEIPEPKSIESLYSPGGELWFTDVQLNAGKGILELRIRDETGRVIPRSWNLIIR